MMGAVNTAERVRTIASRLPEVDTEGDQHVGFSVRGRRFAWYLDDHHGDGIVALSCRAVPGLNTDLVDRFPDRYYIPSYLGARGWVAIRLDTPDVDWAEVEERLSDAYRLAAPKRLAAQVGR